MAPPLVPSPIPRPARPHRGLAASRRRRRGAAPGLAPALVTLTVRDQATRMGWAVAAPEAALALARGTQLVLAPVVAGAAELVEVTNPAQVLVPLTALVPAINPVEVVGTKSRFGGELRTRQPLSLVRGEGLLRIHGDLVARQAINRECRRR